ncbi:MAG TPA: hypothetical protein VGR14_01550 [Verrucomicrobiae bacterium]|nr:hypothetical protein [Verrucomicrobiae bacterium]
MKWRDVSRNADWKSAPRSLTGSKPSSFSRADFGISREKQKTYRRLFGMIFLGPVFECNHPHHNQMRKPTMANGQNKVIFSKPPPPFFGAILQGLKNNAEAEGYLNSFDKIALAICGQEAHLVGNFRLRCQISNMVNLQVNTVQ